MSSTIEQLKNLIEQSSESRQISALLLVLISYILCPIIARLIIKLFHIIFSVDRKTSESAFYGPLKFYIVLCCFGTAM